MASTDSTSRPTLWGSDYDRSCTEVLLTCADDSLCNQTHTLSLTNVVAVVVIVVVLLLLLVVVVLLLLLLLLSSSLLLSVVVSLHCWSQ